MRTIEIARALALGAWAVAASAAETGYRWGTVAMGGGGFVSGIVPSKAAKGVVFARTDVGGMYRWNDSRGTWLPLLDWASENETGYLGVEALAADPTDASRVYALVGISYFNGGKTAILRSSDTGNTFQVTEVSGQFKAHGNGMGRGSGEKLAVDPNRPEILLCGTRWNGLWKSADRGATWTRLTGFPVTTSDDENGVSFILFDSRNGVAGQATQRIWAGVSRMGTDNLYVSEDAGATWNPVPGAITTAMPQRASISSDGMLYLSYGNGAGPHGHWSLPEPMDAGSLRKLAVASGTWTDISPAGFTRAMSGISVDPRDPKHLLATSINTYWQQPNGWGDVIFRSTDAGATWTSEWTAGATMGNGGIPWGGAQTVHWAGSAEIDPFDSERAWVSSGNGIFRTTSLSAAKSVWSFDVAGIEETVPLDAVSIPSGPFVSVIGDYDGFVNASPSAYSPSGRHAPSMGTTTGIAMAGKALTLARSGDQLQVSNDMGATWTALTKPVDELKGRVGLSADGKVLLWSSGTATTLRRCALSSGTWSTATGITASTAPVGDQLDPARFYAYLPGSGQFLASTDTGKSFAAKASPGTGGSVLVRPVPGRTGQVWVPLYGGGLTRTLDGGATWSKFGAVTRCDAVGFGAPKTGSSHPAAYLWGTVNAVTGIFRSDDTGATWTRINDDAHEYGGPANGQFVLGDMNVWGRVYMSTAGRGIAWGEPPTTPVGTASRKASRPAMLRNGSRLVSTSGASLVLTDLEGRRIRSSSAPEGLDLTGLPPGVYLALDGISVLRTVIAR